MFERFSALIGFTRFAIGNSLERRFTLWLSCGVAFRGQAGANKISVYFEGHDEIPACQDLVAREFCHAAKGAGFEWALGFNFKAWGAGIDAQHKLVVAMDPSQKH